MQVALLIKCKWMSLCFYKYSFSYSNKSFFYGITLDTFPIYISLARYPFLKLFLAELLEKNIALLSDYHSENWIEANTFFTHFLRLTSAVIFASLDNCINYMHTFEWIALNECLLNVAWQKNAQYQIYIKLVVYFGHYWN